MSAPRSEEPVRAPSLDARAPLPVLDLDFARARFPALAGGWVFLDNAGRTDRGGGAGLRPAGQRRPSTAQLLQNLVDSVGVALALITPALFSQPPPHPPGEEGEISRKQQLLS
jgi:hypothetical protein